MGGLFRAPKPVIVQPPAPPALPPAPAPEEAAQEARSAARARLGRGLAGTIATSARGVLTPPPLPAGARKTLLGG